MSIKNILCILSVTYLFSCNDPVKNIAETGLKIQQPSIDSAINLGKRIGRSEANVVWGEWLLRQRVLADSIAEEFLKGSYTFDRIKIAYSHTISILNYPNPYDSLALIK